MNALDLPTEDGKTVGEIALQPILDQNINLTVVDVGARGGMYDLPEGYTKHAHWIGFEPNPVEHEKILSNKTDAEEAGIPTPKWKSKTVKQVALWSEPEIRASWEDFISDPRFKVYFEFTLQPRWSFKTSR